MRDALRNYERSIALHALKRAAGDRSLAYETIHAAILASEHYSLDRYLLFNVGCWMLENWELGQTKVLQQELLEVMAKMSNLENALPDKKPPGWEAVADVRESALRDRDAETGEKKAS